MSSRKANEIEWGPFLIDEWGRDEKETIKFDPIQISLHNIKSRSFLSELKIVFGEEKWKNSNYYVICTFQHAKIDLVKFGNEVENEKERLLENFTTFAKTFCSSIISSGYFADFIDPCSGLPIFTDSNTIFNEVQCAQMLLSYRVMNAGCCKILLHPEWGSAVFPASIVTDAPSDYIHNLLQTLSIVRPMDITPHIETSEDPELKNETLTTTSCSITA